MMMGGGFGGPGMMGGGFGGGEVSTMSGRAAQSERVIGMLYAQVHSPLGLCEQQLRVHAQTIINDIGPGGQDTTIIEQGGMGGMGMGGMGLGGGMGGLW